MNDVLKPKNKPSTIITLLVMLFIIGWSWRSCWYATRLSDSEMERRLSGKGTDNDIQKALSQLAERLEEGEEGLEKYFPAVMALAQRETVQLRTTAAWTMGAAPKHEAFRAPLKTLLEDESPTVRHMAACALSSHGDASVRPVLKSMLERYMVPSPAEGELRQPRGLNESVRLGQILGRIEVDGKTVDVITPIEGKLVKRNKGHGDAVREGETIMEIEPTLAQITNALAALGKVGTKEDIPAVKAIADGTRSVDAGARPWAVKVLQELDKR